MARGFATATLLGACLLAPEVSAREPAHPDLGPVRYRDPAGHRTLWVGLDVGGVVLPRRLGWYENRVWTAHATPAWALSLVPGLAIGGRHGMSLYDVTGPNTDVRLRLHEHQLELSGSPLTRWGRTRATDRVFFGVQTHAVLEMKVEETEIHPGGVRDTLAEFGYGMHHPLGARERWALDWRVSGRYAWVFNDTQRHGLAALRLSFRPTPAHQLSASAQGFLVHRDEGVRSPYGRTSVHGVFQGQYAWMSRVGVGPVIGARLSTHFGAGATPVFETRAAAVDSIYGDVMVGLRAHWR